MRGIIRNVLNQSDIDSIFKLYNESSNIVELYGELKNRHNISSNLGMFLLSHFTQKEFQPFLSKIIPSIEAKERIELETTSCRVLKYTKDCFISKHRDIKTSEANSSLSVIIQLSNQDEYVGGKAIIDGEESILQQGDLEYYTYSYEHEVTKIFSGCRYVINLRINIKKDSTLI
jgi:predicted 2-oxoglutarate/Fe(II)-dependent dioxygenase YbiX